MNQDKTDETENMRIKLNRTNPNKKKNRIKKRTKQNQMNKKRNK